MLLIVTLSLFIFFRATPVLTLPQTIRIGVLLDESMAESALKLISNAINQDNKILPNSRILIDQPKFQHNNSFYTARAVCEFLKNGVVGIFGISSSDWAELAKSIAQKFDVPYIEINRQTENEKNADLHFYPTAQMLDRAYADLIESLDWKYFAVIYNSVDKLQSIQSHISNLLQSDPNTKNSTPILRMIPMGVDYKILLREIQGSRVTRILIYCTKLETELLLTQAQELGMMTQEYHYIVTTLDMHLLPISKFQYSGVNIVGFRLVNPNSSEIKQFFGEIEAVKGYPSSQSGKTDATNFRISTELVLLVDALKIFVKTLHILDSTQQIRVKSIKCNESENWGYGSTILNYIKLLPAHGLSGKIDFNNTPFRTNLLLDLIHLTPNGLHNFGVWNSSSKNRLNVFHDQTPEAGEIKNNVNELLTVSIPISTPFIMKKDGNYEGYAIDLLSELSTMLKFNYVLKPITKIQQNHDTSQWDKVIDQVYQRIADIGIGDLTITGARMRNVDFVPFMHHGLTAFYVAPQSKQRNWLSLLNPFDTKVWISIVLAYIVVTTMLYISERYYFHVEGFTNHRKLSPLSLFVFIYADFFCSIFSKAKSCDAIRQEKSNKTKKKLNVINLIWILSNPLSGRSNASKMLSFSWSVFVLLLTSSYTANLSSYFLYNKFTPKISSVSDLLAVNGIQLGCIRSSTTMKYLQDSGNELERLIWQNIKNNAALGLKPTLEDGIEEVIKGQGQFAFVAEAPTVEYNLRRRSGLIQVGNPFTAISYGIALQKDSTLLEPLHQAMLKLQEDSFLVGLKAKWWFNETGYTSEVEPQFYVKPITAENCSSIFIFLTIGCLLAGIFHLSLYFKKGENKIKVADGQDLVKDLEFALKCKRENADEVVVFHDEILTPYLDLGINSYGFPNSGNRVPNGDILVQTISS